MNRNYRGTIYYASKDAQQKRLYKEGQKLTIESYHRAVEFEDSTMVQLDLDSSGTNYVHLALEANNDV